MNILITGSNSFVAKNLIPKLRSNGCNLILTDKFKNTKFKNNITKDLRKLKPKDIGNKKIDTIIHLGAVSTANLFQKKTKESYEINILSLVNIVEIAKEFGVKKVIFASSEWVYGQSVKKKQTENSLIDPERLESDYALSKKIGEDFLRYYSNKYKYNLVILRFGIIYGNKNINLCAIESIVKNIVTNKKESQVNIGSKKTARRFIHVSDIVNAIVKVTKVDFKKNMILNLAGSEIITMKKIIDKVAEITRRNLKIIEKNNKQFNIRNPVSSKIKKVIGWSDKVNLHNGINKLIKFHTNNNSNNR